MASDPLSIHPIPALRDNYIWAMVDATKKNAVIVDPGEASPVIDFLHEHKLVLSGILITHHHGDHTNGAAELALRYHAPVYGPLADNIACVSRPLPSDTIFAIDDFALDFHILSVPGHTIGHAAYYGAGNLFCGDTLFAAGCGRIFEGLPSQMLASLQKMAALPDDTRLYCGHEYTLNNLRFASMVETSNTAIATRMEKVALLRKQNHCSLPARLKDEKETNPFLRCHLPSIKASVEAHIHRPCVDEVEVFAALRKWKDQF